MHVATGHKEMRISEAEVCARRAHCKGKVVLTGMKALRTKGRTKTEQ